MPAPLDHDIAVDVGKQDMFVGLTTELCLEFERLHEDVRTLQQKSLALQRLARSLDSSSSLLAVSDTSKLPLTVLDFSKRQPPVERGPDSARPPPSENSPKEAVPKVPFGSPSALPESQAVAIRVAGPEENSQLASSQRLSFQKEQKEKKAKEKEVHLNLSEEQIEELRQKFDRLDPEGTERITSLQCARMIEQYEGTKVDIEMLSTAIAALDVDHKRSASTDSLDGNDDITFSNFLRLMSIRASSSGGSQMDRAQEALLKKVDVLFHAMDKAEAFQMEMTRRAEAARAKHKYIAFALEAIGCPVIVANALFMGYRLGVPAGYSHILDSVDLGFLIYYTLEAIVRLAIFGCEVTFCGPDRIWNLFDMLCVIISAVDNVLPLLVDVSRDVGGLKILKMLRLIKLARPLKALRYPIFADLKVMIFGVASGVRVLGWALTLLMSGIYLLSIIMVDFAGRGKNGIEEFSTLRKAMFTIFRCFTDGCSSYGGAPLAEQVAEKHGVSFLIAYVLVFMLVTFGLFNLIMAIFVDHITSNSVARKQQTISNSHDDTKRRLEDMFAFLIMHCKTAVGKRHHMLTRQERQRFEEAWHADENRSFPEHVVVNRTIFKKWCMNPEFVDLMDEIEIDAANLTDLFDVLDSDMSGELTPREIVDGLMKLRGPITKADIVAIRMKARYIAQMIEKGEAEARRIQEEVELQRIQEAQEAQEQLDEIKKIGPS